MKFQIIVQPITGKILQLGRLFKGKTHDFKMFKKMDTASCIEENEILMGDSGYQGMHHYCKTVIPKRSPEEEDLVKLRRGEIQSLVEGG